MNLTAQSLRKRGRKTRGSPQTLTLIALAHGLPERPSQEAAVPDPTIADKTMTTTTTVADVTSVDPDRTLVLVRLVHMRTTPPRKRPQIRTPRGVRCQAEVAVIVIIAMTNIIMTTTTKGHTVTNVIDPIITTSVTTRATTASPATATIIAVHPIVTKTTAVAVVAMTVNTATATAVGHESVTMAHTVTTATVGPGLETAEGGHLQGSPSLARSPSLYQIIMVPVMPEYGRPT
jgi:hypothetical protein